MADTWTINEDVPAVVKTMTTYKRADGDQIGDFGWVSELDWFDTDYEPTELIEEVWALQSTRTIIAPSIDGRVCVFEVPDSNGDWCEAEAVKWVPTDDTYEPRCAKHGGEA